jgi:RNA 2',3'-cyclic 3'-phosphodiesterase
VPRSQAIEPEKPLRLFVAADVPAPVKAAVEAAVEPHRDRVRVARWTLRDSWHVTLKFLGSTWPRQVEEVKAAVRAVASSVAPFETHMTEIGVFPSVRRARVVWAGVDDPGGRFAGLAGDLDIRLEEDFAPETREFTPHLTLARLTPSRNLGEFAPDLVGTPIESEPFAVDSVVLYRSRLAPGGARYEALERFPLGGVGGGA